MLKTKTSFDPEEVRLLDHAYRGAIAALALPLCPAVEWQGDLHLKIARRIMHLALQGERDPDRLRAAALSDVRFAALAA